MSRKSSPSFASSNAAHLNGFILDFHDTQRLNSREQIVELLVDEQRYETTDQDEVGEYPPGVPAFRDEPALDSSRQDQPQQSCPDITETSRVSMHGTVLLEH